MLKLSDYTLIIWIQPPILHFDNKVYTLRRRNIVLSNYFGLKNISENFSNRLTSTQFIIRDLTFRNIFFAFVINPQKKFGNFAYSFISGNVELTPWSQFRHTSPASTPYTKNKQNIWKLYSFINSWKCGTFCESQCDVIEKPTCWPFQRHVIHCNRLLLSEDTALWIIRLCHKSNLTT